jgi:hypothetical protein
MKPIYNPKGAAKEYCEWALNIYTGCPHRCFYCYCPQVLRRDAEEFFTRVEPRKNIVEETRKQLEREHITDKLIQLCFIGDPYPTGYDTTPTREIIKLLKEYGNHVQILTKGDGTRDFDLLDGNDWYGITLDCGTRKVTPVENYGLSHLTWAHDKGIKTWISFEPVLNAKRCLLTLKYAKTWADKVKIGKLNYHPSNIDWKAFGVEAEALCRELGLDYTIKESLRREMEKP